MRHAIDSQGRIYFALSMDDCLLRFDSWFDTEPTAFGESGSGEGHLRRPVDVWIDSEDRIHIEDAGNQRVVRIDDISGAGWTVLEATPKPEI